MAIEIKSGNQGVRITSNDGSFFSVMVVNCREGFTHPNAVVVASKHSNTEAAARRWASKQMEAA